MKPARARPGERQRAVALAVLDQPVDAADLVDLRVADRRQPLRQEVDLRPVLPPQRRLAMNDAVREASQRARTARRDPCGRTRAPRSPAIRCGKIERIAGEDDLEFDFVVQVRLCEQPIDVVIHQAPGEIVGDIARHERVEADADVDVGQAMKTHQQRKTAKILIAVVVALIGPDRVGDQLPVQRQRQGPRPQPDDLRRDSNPA